MTSHEDQEVVRRSAQGARCARPARRAVRGAVYVETLLCLLTLLTLVLGITQLAWIAMARLVVHHAAYQAARSAVVVLEDDPRRYRGAPRGDLAAGKKSSGGRVAPSKGGKNATKSRAPSGARMQEIRLAAYFPLATLAPGIRALLSSPRSLHEALDAGSWVALGMGVASYGKIASAITVRAAPRSATVLSRVGPKERVTVRVTYVLRCFVPLAARLICDGFGATLSRAGGDQRLRRELEYAESPELLPLVTLTERFKVIEAEATLPNQGADYVH